MQSPYLMKFLQLCTATTQTMPSLLPWLSFHSCALQQPSCALKQPSCALQQLSCALQQSSRCQVCFPALVSELVLHWQTLHNFFQTTPANSDITDDFVQQLGKALTHFAWELSCICETSPCKLYNTPYLDKLSLWENMGRWIELFVIFSLKGKYKQQAVRQCQLLRRATSRLNGLRRRLHWNQ